jgi:hypothetical protein
MTTTASATTGHSRTLLFWEIATTSCCFDPFSGESAVDHNHLPTNALSRDYNPEKSAELPGLFGNALFQGSQRSTALQPSNYYGFGMLAAPPPKPSPNYLERFANANYGQELQKPNWTTADAVPILLGKDPVFLNVRDIEANQATEEIALEAARLRLLVSQAQEIGDLAQKFRPVEFINWAIRQHVHVPEGLLKVAKDRRLPITGFPDDLKILSDAYDALQKKSALRLSSLKEQNTGMGQLCCEQKSELEICNRRIKELEANLAAQVLSLAERPIETVEKKPDKISSLSRKYNKAVLLLYGVIKIKYGIEFGKATIVLKPIIEDLANRGITVDDETLRDHLLAGSEQASKT